MFLVTGATGGLGRRVVRLLCDRDQPVRAFVRLTSSYQELEDRGAQVLIGDLKRDRDIERACQGVRYVISTHGAGMDAEAIEYRANIDLIDDAIAADVQHFVYISVLGADRGYQDSAVFKAKREVEKYLQNSGLNYTILRPAALSSSLISLAEQFRQTGVYLLIGEANNRTSVVSTDDLANIAIESVDLPEALNQILPVGGPELLTRNDIPQIFGRIFNREPIILNPPLSLFDGARSALGFVNPELQKSLGTLRVLLANEFLCTSEEVERIESLFDMKMESLETFLRRYLAV
ncbi:SDR family oxidoreductase [Roseofilum casamattae]|uniref:SDR family oxidoreductase n=1 Tax=Roseofilum casamattae BLCC-M143 TaxID=3022442 RepID=A0ABT7BZY4_9CYAN|nr:SDR family oxidoreductase [Roseofilum casamattae]MDJ1184769.1 SDR family oxidoreductase [Roseofilum casamattae BLCC-M143]